MQGEKFKNFTRFISQHLKKMATRIKLEKVPTIAVSRHTFSTRAVNKGISMDMVGAALGHRNAKTTKRYFEGFDSDLKKEMAEKLGEI